MAILRSSLPLPKSGPKGKVTLGAVIGAMDAVAGMTPFFSLRLTGLIGPMPPEHQRDFQVLTP